MSVQNAVPALEPVKPSDRILELDVLRGCALFGVLLAYALWNLGSPPEETYSAADRILNRLLTMLVDKKAYTIFAVMFGLGFSIQLRRASARGVSVVRIYIRRLLALLLIGLIHALLLRNGDILVPYAVMGFFLILFRNASNTTLVVVGLVALLFPYFSRSLWMLTGVPFPRRPNTEGVGHLAANLAWVRYWYSTAIAMWPESLPMFLFGLYVGRKGLHENLSSRRRGLRIMLAAGLTIGLGALAAVELLSTTWSNSQPTRVKMITLGLLWTLHAWGLAGFYCSTLLLLLQKVTWQKLLAPVGAVGRMALTNYLLQAALIVPACISFGLYDKVTPTIGVLLALGVWVVQISASVWWLKRFQFGPAEWVWRSLTYGARQPMRIVREESAAAVAY